MTASYEELKSEAEQLEDKISTKMRERHNPLPRTCVSGGVARSTRRWYLRRDIVLLKHFRERMEWML